jgi:hypothetical protein
MLARRGSSFRELHVLFRVLRPSTCPWTKNRRTLRPFGTSGSASHGVSCPHHDVSRQRPHTRGHPFPRFGPSSAFRTPSTVYATTGLAGLFHPAAAYRVRPSGDCPPPGARTGFPIRRALVPLCDDPPVLTPGRTRRPRLQGLAPQTGAVVSADGEIVGHSAPLVDFFLLRVFPPRTVRHRPDVSAGRHRIRLRPSPR